MRASRGGRASFGFFDAWTLAFLFGFQIYFDFAGYSHIAIGSAKLLGITLPENFNFPYLATSPREFWQRWHISLSTWIRDYLYLPLLGTFRSARDDAWDTMSTTDTQSDAMAARLCAVRHLDHHGACGMAPTGPSRCGVSITPC